MPLILTSEGVRVLKDWDRERIGKAYLAPGPEHGESAAVIQDAIVQWKVPQPLPEAVKVPVLPTLEKLVRFLST